MRIAVGEKALERVMKFGEKSAVHDVNAHTKND